MYPAQTDSFFYPTWPAPKTIKAITTTRQGGFSGPPFDSLNLASHVGDDNVSVEKNRQHLVDIAQLPEVPRWLDQVHGTDIINSADWQSSSQADGIFSDTCHHVCAIMTADCLPILMCNRQGDQVAAIHAGWRGIANGIIEHAISNFNDTSSNIIAWFGPAIGPTQFEVGTDVFEQFNGQLSSNAAAFTKKDNTHYLADIYMLASQRLKQGGINAIFGGNHCSVSEHQRFFSYRREGVTGRMASLIWIDSK